MTPLVSRDRYDAFVFDLDGTLLDGRACLSERTIAAVAAVREAGYAVVLATGRSLCGTRDVHAALRLDSAICAYNGAFIGDPSGEAPWHYAPIPDDHVAHLVALERRARFLFRHSGHRKFTARGTDAVHGRVAAWFTDVEHVDGGASALPSADLVRVSLFYDGPDAIEAAWTELGAARDAFHRETFPMSIFPDFEDVGLHLCEVQRRGRGKAEVFRYLAERHGIPASRVVAVGDQRNDLPLLSGAGLAVAMGNAVDEVRALAHVVIGDHRDDGVARFLEEHALGRTGGGGGGGEATPPPPAGAPVTRTISETLGATARRDRAVPARGV